MAGRRRKDGDRHPSGRLVQSSHPDPKVIDQRRRFVGGFADPDRKGREVDPHDIRASYPIGVLYLRGALTKADHEAAMRFAGLYAISFGRGTVKSHLAGFLPAAAAQEIREDRRLEIARELGHAIAAVQALSTRRPYEALLNLAVFERPMRFMDTSRARTPAAWEADQRDKDALCEATDCLVRLWKIGPAGS